jgi:hypothetical protein
VVVKRAVIRRDPLNTKVVPSMCYNECNNCFLEAQKVGKSAALCAAGSAFQQDYAACQECAVANGDTTQSSLKLNVIPDFQQWLTFCQGTPAQPEVSGSPGTPQQPQSQISAVAPSAGSPVSVQSASPPNTSGPPLPVSTSGAGSGQSATAPPAATSTAPGSTSSTSSTSVKPSGTTSTPTQFTGGTNAIRPIGFWLIIHLVVLGLIL